MAELALVIPTRDGEARINLHPISLALVAAELIEGLAYRRCRRRGHSATVGDYCGRCGTSLPDDSTDDLRPSWHPGAIRSWGPRPDAADLPVPTTGEEA